MGQVLGAILVCGMLVSVSALADTTTLSPDGYQYHIADRVALNRMRDGIDGELQVLEDARITPDVRGKMIPSDSDVAEALRRSGVEKDDPVLKSFDAIRAYPAIVRLVDVRGDELDESELDRPLAEIDHQAIALKPAAYKVSEDEGTGAGRASFWVTTRIVSVANRKMRWASVIDDFSRTEDDLSLVVSPRRSWSAIVNDKDPSRIEFLEVECSQTARFDPDRSLKPSKKSVSNQDQGWQLRLSRYRLVKGVWHRRDRLIFGKWDSGDPLPAIDEFPK